MFAGFHNDKIFPVNMTGPDSFELDGQEYTGKPQSAGREFAPGEKAHVVFTGEKSPFGGPVGRRMPLIFAGATRRAWMVEGPSSITVDVTAWLQSHQGPGGLAIGGKVDPGLLNFGGSTTFWNLPTSDTTGTIHAGVRPYGMVRYQPPPGDGPAGDFYGCSWAFLRETAGGYGWKIGAWDVSTRAPQWEAEFGATDGSFVNPDSPKHLLFADPITAWLHAFPEIGSTPSRLFSAKDADNSYTTIISRDQGTSNASLQSFTVQIDESTTEIQSWFVFPSVDATTAGGQASVDFWKMASDGSWSAEASFDSAYIPNGGPSSIPDCLPFGSATHAPIPWLGKRAIAFSSGGQRGLFGSDQWEKHHWAVRALDVNGVDSQLLASRTLNATDSPRVLTNASLKTQALAAPYDLNWDGSFRWIGGGIELGSDTNSAWAYFPNLAPVLLPASTPNLNRITTLESALAVSSSEIRRWPAELRNLGGGISVDSNNTVWFVVLETEQILLGGTYEIYDSGLTQDTWTWRYNAGCFASTISGVVPDGIHPVSGAPSNPTPGSPVSLTTPDGCSPGVDRFQTWSFDVDSPTQKALWKFRYTQKPGWLQRMKLIGIRTNGISFSSLLELDISQKADISVTAALGGGASGLGGAGSTSYTVVENDFPLASNSWQAPISFADRGIVSLLVDRRADGLGNNPTPHLETYSVTEDALTLVSSVRLGSYTELKSTDNTSIVPGWLAGDQVWDPYAFGGPRMKACRKENGAPIILAMVGENKKVDTDTESQFKRVCYALIDLEDPSAPVVSRVAYTSPDEGVGASGDIPEHFPLWDDWDTLVLTPGHVAWIRDSQFRETLAP